MKLKITFLICTIIFAGNIFAQQDTTAVTKDSISITKTDDTIRVGGIIILKKGEQNEKNRVVVTVGSAKKTKKSNLSTKMFSIDLGLTNWSDHTDYPSATAANLLVNQPGKPDLAPKDFKLRQGKSVNINIWIVTQQANLLKHYLNLRYAIGLELNNYRFKSNVSLSEGGLNPYDPAQNISHAFAYRSSESFSKNKLAADYLTVPLMLNFRSNPGYSNRGVGLSAGVSMGYLYSSRNKQKGNESGKRKNKGDYDLERWKFSYVGDLSVGPVTLYGSYSPKSIFKSDLNFQPYTIGVRLVGKW